jgi:hypothetical protein
MVRKDVAPKKFIDLAQIVANLVKKVLVVDELCVGFVFLRIQLLTVFAFVFGFTWLLHGPLPRALLVEKTAGN